MDQETIYGANEDSHIVMSEKVQTLAGSIYQEFEKMMAKYDEDVVKDLMPLVVNVLECLDLSYTENQEHEVELELLKEDNEQLVTQYEREKQLRKSADQKLLQIEDALEDERKDLSEKVESLESIVRMLELKAKNSSDHVYRLEEKEQEMKKEFAKLHERYTELFKTHMDCMERTKILMGTGERTDVSGRSRLPAASMSHMSRSSGPISFGFSSLECGTANMAKSVSSPMECSTISASPPESNQSNTCLRNELHAELQSNVCVAAIDEEPSEKGWSETLGLASKDNSPDQDLSEDLPPILSTTATPVGKSHTKREQRSGNTLYQELSFQDAEALGEMDDGVDITGSWVHPGDYASSVNDNFFGMGKEVENLILENNELLATKNALNVVKDDLIMKVDELTSEQEMFKEEIKSLLTLKSKLMQRINELEDELKCTKEEAEKLAKSNKSDDEEDIPMAQRKRFTRVEMARVLLERNQYKERFMELQEAVRWSEMIRATKNDPNLDKKNKHGVFWKFFGSLFSGSGDNRAGGGSNSYQKKDLPLGYVHYNAPTYHVSPALETMRRRHINDRRRGFDYFDSNDAGSGSGSGEKARRAIEKKDQFRQVRAHVSKDDGRLRAYGWSLPGNKMPTPAAPPLPSSSSHVPVPVPVYCRPLMEHEPGMKIWCATGVNLSGGRTRDGGDIVGASVFYSTKNWRTEVSDDAANEIVVEPAEDTLQNSEIAEIDKELKEGEQLRMENEIPHMQRLSSLVWICTTTKSVSKVIIIDANNPGDILHTFTVCQAHLLCIASVPGAKESDYSDDSQVYENENHVKRVDVENGRRRENDDGDGDDDDDDDNDNDNDNDGDGDGDEDGDSINSTHAATSTVTASGVTSAHDDKDTGIGKITFVSCATGSDAPPLEQKVAASASLSDDVAAKSATENDTFSTSSKCLETAENILEPDDAETYATDGGDDHPQPEPCRVPLRRLIRDIKEGLVKDGLTDSPSDNDVANEEMEKMSSVLPTIWLGAQNGYIFVHSAVSQWRRCLHSIKLKDSVLSITHILGKVICALADGTIAVFRRGTDGQWDLSNYHSVRLGPDNCSVRCLVAVHSRIWCGYRNKIHVLDAKTLRLLKSFDAHPRKDSQVRQMAWLGDGVWVSIRLDSTLRLYHAHTYEHLQDVDIEPYVSKMLGPGKVGFSFVRITALLISSHRLWIGTGNGVIISVPLSEYATNKVPTTSGAASSSCSSTSTATAAAAAATARSAGVAVRVFCDLATSEVTGASFVPYCSMAQAQLSFHGHRDAVKFFVAVPGNGGISAATSEPSEGPIVESVCENELLPSMLVISGGEGYIDFRTGETEDELEEEESTRVGVAKPDLCQLIVWQVALPYSDFQR